MPEHVARHCLGLDRAKAISNAQTSVAIFTWMVKKFSNRSDIYVKGVKVNVCQSFCV